jgi:hypothetical protein
MQNSPDASTLYKLIDQGKVSPSPDGLLDQAELVRAVLREYPEGLIAAELRVLLGAEKSLTDTCTGMFKHGLLRRGGTRAICGGRMPSNDGVTRP